jgi:hypothetical protein
MSKGKFKWKKRTLTRSKDSSCVWDCGTNPDKLQRVEYYLVIVKVIADPDASTYATAAPNTIS